MKHIRKSSPTKIGDFFIAENLSGFSQKTSVLVGEDAPFRDLIGLDKRYLIWRKGKNCYHVPKPIVRTFKSFQLQTLMIFAILSSGAAAIPLNHIRSNDALKVILFWNTPLENWDLKEGWVKI